MNNSNLPPIPHPGETGPQTCETICLYLAVIDDLAPQQKALLSSHVNSCPDCTEELRQLSLTTHLVASGLAHSAPSPRVDRAIMAALASQNDGRAATPVRRAMFGRPAVGMIPLGRLRPSWLAGSLATAAIIVIALLGALIMSGVFPVGTGPHTFSLPQNLSWSGYVLYHSETSIGNNGKSYHIYTYNNLGVGMMHVETMIDGSLDVVAMEDEKSGEVLGMDMIHHVAQWGADEWMVDDSAFNLAQLRHDLATNNAIYLGKGTFKGQLVYRIRLKNGLVLLLDMHYQPVNVLQDVVGPGTGEPMYDSLKLLPSSQVSEDMWNMSVPPAFHIGKLPPKP